MSMNNYLEQWQAGVDLGLKVGDKVGLFNGEKGTVIKRSHGRLFIAVNSYPDEPFEVLLDGTIECSERGLISATTSPIIYPLKDWHMTSPALIERKIKRSE